MSTHMKEKANWSVKEGSYQINYNLTYSVNSNFEEIELWEYGIQCELLDCNNTIISVANINHITNNYERILVLIQKLVNNNVFPIHLHDVITDLLDEENLVVF